MLKRIRILLAAVSFICILLLFCDFTGFAREHLSFIAKLQLWPAIVSLNIVAIIAIVVITLLCGRIYCSIVCPLGIFQDIITHIAAMRRRNRQRFHRNQPWLRIAVLIVFIAAFLFGLAPVVALIEPYSIFGRATQSFIVPLYQLANNGLAYVAEQIDSFAFYRVDIYIKGVATMAIATATIIIVGILAWRYGRRWCNTICPVGTILGFLSRFSLLQINIDTDKCNSCGLCARNCKAECIDSKAHTIDKSRCVACMNCIGKCHQSAISFARRKPAPATTNESIDSGKRSLLTATALLATTQLLKAKEKTVDGGLAIIEDKEVPEREQFIVPPGAMSIRNFAKHCTGCQLCVAACPNNVLRPSTDLLRLMQPESSYELGYCRPECTACSEVCPTGAIVRLTRAEKSSTQIGHAVWKRWNCIPLTDDVECGNCARHCPTGAIEMVVDEMSGRKIPAVDTERCIGCGACENLCPARPLAAIVVEGHVMHRTI